MSDLRFAFRLLRKEQAFTLVASGILALGVGAVATQYSVVNSFLFRGLPFPDAEQLQFIQRNVPDNARVDNGVPGADLDDWRKQQTCYEDLAGFLNGSTVNIVVDSEARRYTGAYVTPNFLKVLGARVALGRDLTEDDNLPGAPRVTLIADGLWKRDFGGKPDVIGKSFRMNGRNATVVGVLPTEFARFGQEEFWIPLYNEFDLRERKPSTTTTLGVVGRLKKTASTDQAQVQLNTIAARLATTYPETNRDFTEVRIKSVSSFFFGDQFRGLLFVMLAVVGTVLLIACVNVMNMQFARTVMRGKEIAIRSAMGASPWRVMRQMLIEGIVLASVGAALGILLAVWAIDLVWKGNEALPFPLPSWMHINLDFRVLFVVAGCAVLSGILSTLLPAWLATRSNLHTTLKDTGRGNSSATASRLSRVFVIFQIALTCALLVATLFMVRSIWNQQNVDCGYDTHSVLTARMGLFEADFPQPADRFKFYDRVVRELRNRPDFADVAMTDRFRTMFSPYEEMRIEGVAYERDKDVPSAFRAAVSDGYFKSINLRPLEGREFEADDREERLQVALVNATFAKKFFPGKSPVGQKIRDGKMEENRPWRIIVGVVPDTLLQGPFDNLRDGAGIFVPLEAAPAPFMTIVIRPREAGRDPMALVPALREEMRKQDANLPLYFISTPAQTLNEMLAGQRLVTTLFGCFGGIAIILAAAGLYGVMAFSVNQRMSEFGIRVALGALGQQILTLVYRQGTRQVLIGLAAGMATAVILLRVFATGLRNFLFQVQFSDPLIYLGVATMLALVAALACLFPALRASRVDPIEALRAE